MKPAMRKFSAPGSGGNATPSTWNSGPRRRCFAVEISPAYCDVTVQRWETYTGKKAKREDAQ